MNLGVEGPPTILPFCCILAEICFSESDWTEQEREPGYRGKGNLSREVSREIVFAGKEKPMAFAQLKLAQ